MIGFVKVCEGERFLKILILFFAFSAWAEDPRLLVQIKELLKKCL